LVATQNPVDLDYKALSNAGTWMLGRLQTDRDKQRVLDGLEGASQAAGGRLDRAAIGTMLSGLGKRVFLMQNAHDDGPVLFESRWAMSYLRGPLTLQQIQTLTVLPAASPGSARRAAPKSTSAGTASAGSRPLVAPDVEQVFL